MSIEIKAPTTGEVPEEHREAYAELCDQFHRAMLKIYLDAQHTMLVRELPPALRINALLVGATTAALMPLLMMTERGSDFEIANHMAKRVPDLVIAARQMADAAKAMSSKLRS